MNEKATSYNNYRDNYNNICTTNGMHKEYVL